MWFRNARVFRFTKPFDISAEALEEKLQGDAFKPCGPQETTRQGWVPPLGKHSDMLVHSTNGYHLIALRKEDKILPGSVVKEIVEERAEAIEIEQSRKVRRKEKDEIKEQVMLEMLPQAFSKNRRSFAYLAPQDGLLVVDAGSSKQAEDLASFLRKSLGSLPVRPPAVEQAPAFTFTGWLNENIDLPGTIELGTECELKDPSEDGGVVRCKGLDLKADEIRNHLDAGMQVTKLSLTWEDNLSFVLDEELGIKRLKFGDTLQEKLDDVDADDAAARFDAAFALMTLELARLIPGLLEALGGEDRSAIIEES
jgi:recombination associated protein RdgC